jgi:hypothetical protein
MGRDRRLKVMNAAMQCPAWGSRMWASAARFLDRRHNP